jgi:DNA-binding MarR family transcriptional regulator
MRRTSAGDTFTEIVTAGLKVSALLEQAGEVLTAPDGQSAARWKVLGVVSKHQLTVAEIARALRQSRQGVQKVADALVQDDLALYVDNPSDRRAKILVLTGQGKAVLSGIQTRHCAWADRLGAKLPTDELVIIKGALEKLLAILCEEG